MMTRFFLAPIAIALHGAPEAHGQAAPDSLPGRACADQQEFAQLKSGERIDGCVEAERRLNQGWVIVTAGAAYPASEVSAFTDDGRYVVNHGVFGEDLAGRKQVEETLLERVENGRLALYGPYQSEGPASSPTYFSKGDGAVKKLNYQNLRAAILDDPASVQSLEASRRWGRARNGMVIGGSVAVGIGLLRSVYDTRSDKAGTEGQQTLKFKADALLIVGGGTVLGGIVSSLLKRAHFRSALRTYNDRPPAEAARQP